MMTLLPLFIFWGLWYLNFSARAIFSPILPLIEDTLSISHWQAGGLFTSLAVGYSLILLISGRFAEIWGYKRTVVSGFIGIGLIFLGLQWANSYLAFHILFFFLGIAAGTYLPSILPIITETYESRHWGKVLGIHDSAASLSILFAPILVALGLHFLSWRTLLLLLGVVSLLLPIYFWKVSVEPRRGMSQPKSGISNLLKRRTLWILGFLWIFAAASSLGLYSILPLYLIKERGIDFDFANTLFGISRVGGVFISIFIGFLIDRYGYRFMLMFCLVTTGLSTIGLALSSTLPMIVATLVLQATLSVGFFPAGFAALSNLTPLSERSMAIGVAISIGVIFGNGGAPALLGFIADHFSFQVGIIWLGILTALSSLAVRFLGKEKV
jgi:NNP family nitrate/nitrite transporter-like MFS transporter